MAIHHCDSQNQVHIFTNQDGHLFDLSARTQWPEKGLKSGFPTKVVQDREGVYAQLHGLWRKSFTIVSHSWFLLIGLLSLETQGDDAALMSIDSKGTNVRVRQGAQFNIQRGLLKMLPRRASYFHKFVSLEPVDILSCLVCQVALQMTNRLCTVGGPSNGEPTSVFTSSSHDQIQNLPEVQHESLSLSIRETQLLIVKKSYGLTAIAAASAR
ncbi:hypothetical protein Tco_0455952 [Tanacetum coccineum]